MARLLAPREFGVFAVALVALAALLAFNELGVSLALVRWQGDPRLIAPTVTTVALTTSAVLYVALWFTAPVVAEALQTPDATGVIRLLGVSLLIDGMTVVPAAFITREFQQGRRLAVDLTNLGLSTAVTVTLAVLGFGAISLAWGRLVANGFTAVLLFRLSGTHFRPGWDRKLAPELLAFGLPLAGASLLVFAMLNIDSIIVGGLLGTVALGFYIQAVNLSSWPVNTFSSAVRRVSLAGFSRLVDDPPRLIRALNRSNALLVSATLPVCALLGTLAEPLVTLVYGERWRPSAAALQYLAIFGAARVLVELAYDFLVAVGRSRLTLYLQLVWFATLLPSILVGARLGGIAGVAIGQAAVSMLLIVPLFVAALVRNGATLRGLSAPLLRPILGTAGLIATVFAVLALTDPGVVQLFAAGSLGVVVYAAFAWPMVRLLRV